MSGASNNTGGLCVFNCATLFSAVGGFAALAGYDLGAESAFFAINGLGALCFAKCQYLKLGLEMYGRKQGHGFNADDKVEGYLNVKPWEDSFNPSMKFNKENWWSLEYGKPLGQLPFSMKKIGRIID